jgi:signal transduction histidine kinase
MISPFGLSGCISNLIIGGICIFVFRQRAGRGWLAYVGVVHFIAAIIYALVSLHRAGADIEHYLHAWAGLPVPLGLAISSVLLVVIVVEMFGRPVRVATSAALTGAALLAVAAIAGLAGPFAAYAVAHITVGLLFIASGIALLFGPTAFYRLTGISFLGRGIYAAFIIYIAAHGAEPWIYEVAISFNLIFICLTGLGFILIELDDTRARIAEANLTKTLFIANMSHELRTPLNAIIGFSEMIESSYLAVPLERCRDYAGDILTSARHLLTVINQLLDMASIEARRDKLVVEEICLNTLLTDCAGMIEGEAAAKGVRMLLINPVQLTHIHADQRALRQIVLSLASNAVKFSSAGTAVTLELKADAAAEMVGLVIRDQGPGIDPVHLQRIFEPFWQAQNPYKRRHGGVGLGLAIARSLARSLGGDIAVESTVGQGSSFTVSLPRQMPDASTEAVIPPARRLRRAASIAE